MEIAFLSPFSTSSLPFFFRAFEGLHMVKCLYALRALCNGKTSAFQADDAGSIPAARFKPFEKNHSE
tara:strand:- start:419 stop:619 length:201 start_codon:yes stop_codon:yes gene_type:complete